MKYLGFKVWPKWPRSMVAKIGVLLVIQMGGCGLFGMYAPLPQPPPRYYVVCTYRDMSGDIETAHQMSFDKDSARAIASHETSKNLEDGTKAAFCSILPPLE